MFFFQKESKFFATSLVVGKWKFELLPIEVNSILIAYRIGLLGTERSNLVKNKWDE